MRQVKNKILIVAIIILAMAAKPAAATSKGLMKDSLALLSFYNDTKDSRFWGGNRRWENKPVKRWFGVGLEKRGGEMRVTKLVLRGTFFSKIEGSIPASFGNLEYLEYIMFTNHNFNSPLPPEIGNLKNLNTLIIESSHLTGKVPSTIKNLSKLELLSFYKNDLSGNPFASLTSLKNLTRVFLNNNQFVGAVPSLDNLNKLVELNAGHNKLSGDPAASIESCKKLERLDFSDNPSMKTRNILVSLGNFPLLENLDIDNTKINGTMPEIEKINKNLIYVDLDSTGLKGKIPNSINNLTRLNELYISQNEVTELPKFIGLSDLGAADNKLEYDDIEKNLTIPGFMYDPQASVYNKLKVTLRQGSKVTFNSEIGGKANVYQWRRDFRRVDTSNSAQLVVDDFQLSDEGNYTCSIKNGLATRTIIRRKSIDIETTPRPEIDMSSFPITIDGDIGIEGATYQWSNGSRKTKTTFHKGDTLSLKITIGKDLIIEEEWIIDPPELPWDQAPPAPEKIITFKNVLFERGMTKVIAGEDELDKLANMLLAFPEVRIKIMGHTDNQGDPRENKILSENRTKVIRNYLVGKGVKSYRISVEGFGGDMPKYSNLKESTRRLNRRVEFMVIE